MSDVLRERNDSLRGALRVVDATKASVSQADDGDQHAIAALIPIARDLSVAADALQMECADRLRALSEAKG